MSAAAPRPLGAVAWLLAPMAESSLPLPHTPSSAPIQVLQPGYQAFLRYACPGFNATGVDRRVPTGDDVSQCPRCTVLGTYDDHDSGANNDNRRLPGKHAVKQASAVLCCHGTVHAALYCHGFATVGVGVVLV